MDITEECKQALFNFKSSDIYLKWINKYKSWLTSQDLLENAQSVLQYLIYWSDVYAASTLWSIYSILNKYAKVYLTINLNDCVLIKDFL
jgi:hypothetical protein